MKPTIEHIDPGYGSSFRIRRFEQQFRDRDPVWHFHPEYEIVYISKGRGKRQIGNHISYYRNGDLLFLGPNLPHFGFTQEALEGQHEIVVQMKEDFLGANFLQRPEMTGIQNLLERTRTGLSFSGETRQSAGKMLMEIVDAQPFDRLLGLLKVLHLLAESTEVTSLNANGFTIKVMIEDEARVQRIYQHIQEHFREPITLTEISQIANMTVPAFCRFFKKLSNQTFTQFVNEFRVAHACKLLTEEDMLITDVAHESGFNNLSHFNKSFFKVTHQRPSEYRKQSGKVMTFV